MLMRQLHRWLSIGFTLIVATIFACQPFWSLPEWLYYLPLLPLALLVPSGLYLFVLPYVAKSRGAARPVGKS